MIKMMTQSLDYPHSFWRVGVRLQTRSVIRLGCTNLITTSSNFDVFVKLFNLRFYFISKSWFRAKPDLQLLIFHSLFREKSLFSKISNDFIACDLRFGSPIQSPSFAYLHYTLCNVHTRYRSLHLCFATRIFRVVAYNIAKVQSIRCIASSLKLL